MPASISQVQEEVSGGVRSWDTNSKKPKCTYEDITSIENLLAAWQEFVKGKGSRSDVQQFKLHLMNNILSLHCDLSRRIYRHGGYLAFKISDPKPRDIHKATVRDRLLHHAIYRQLYPHFDRTFIADSYSCRKEKGTHKSMERFRSYAYQVSKNNTRTCYVLKCDIRKFFASIDQEILIDILRMYISDENILWLIQRVVGSFSSTEAGKGLPLGNLTSQLLVNVYMNEMDQFAKHKLKARHYIRYADDFVFLSDDRIWLESLIPRIELFLQERLKLELHPKKVSIGTLSAGVDFLGWVHFPDHRVLRTTAKRRMLKSLEAYPSPETVVSYRGMLTHGNTHKLSERISSISAIRAADPRR
ncbi:MAG: reverse transcriptase domain-containing protein [Candidatus Pacebacteria bacterium]|nr:reverse transcriptase domain-containing protein [Candidatus Paceibacterota bacterium]